VSDPFRSGEVNIGLIQMKMGSHTESNLKKALAMITEAKQRGAEIVCLPELFLSEYFPQRKESRIEARRIPSPETEALSAAARNHGIAIIAGSFYELDGKDRYNTCIVFDSDGSTVGKYRKVHIPQDPGFYEQDYFKAGSKFEVFRTFKARVGPLICFDQWYPEPARSLKLQGADLIFYPTAIGTVDGVEEAEGDWHKAWESVQVGHAISNSVVVAAVNRVGKEGNMNFWGGSFVCDQFGKILVRADQEEGVFLANCNLNLAKEVEQGWGFLRNRKPNAYKELVKSREE
jgi:predicted amidohydrolase